MCQALLMGHPWTPSLVCTGDTSETTTGETALVCGAYHLRKVHSGLLYSGWSQGTLLSTPFLPLGAQSAGSSWPSQIWPHAIISSMMKSVVCRGKSRIDGHGQGRGLSGCAEGCRVDWRSGWPRVGGCHGRQYLQKPP